MHSNLYKTFNPNYRTPDGFYKQLDSEFHFDFDPCPPNPSFDGLKIRWGVSNYVNPPYGKEIRNWLIKALVEKITNHSSTVFLLPAYKDVKWFHEIVLPNASEIRFIKGRLTFDGNNNTAPFASMIVVFKP